MEKVTVLMSTYNGEKYIEEQIDSILNQQDITVNLFIRDDGSSDKTVAILNRYKKEYTNVDVVFGENIGWKKSFFYLLENTAIVSGIYYAFADQDDIWLPNKMIIAVRRMNHKIPMLYHSNVTIVNTEKAVIGNRYSKTFSPSKEIVQAFLDGYGVGATMVFNVELLLILSKYKVKQATNHDAYLIALCNLFGQTIYDKNSYILYRRHSENATGFGKSKRIQKPTLIMRYKRYKKGPKNNFSIRAQELISGYGYILPNKEKYFLKLLANYRKSKRNKIILLTSTKIKASSLRKTLQIKYRAINNTL
ncbi:MAG: glycosyltransferase family 2 protein [Latilactobacillus curvatus]